METWSHSQAIWDEFGIDCATLEANYSWDCSGCACPGDVACEDQGLITCEYGAAGGNINPADKSRSRPDFTFQSRQGSVSGAHTIARRGCQPAQSHNG